MKKPDVHYREEVFPEDVLQVQRLAQSAKLFYPEEIVVAIELVRERLAKGTGSGYYFLFLEDEKNKVIGYACFGPIPATKESFDLYWIVVDRKHQGQGLGKELIKASEQMISSMGGSRIYVETSSREQYKDTQQFYLKAGYHEEACMSDFYAPGDNKIIYLKQIS
jgi:GNAT superfamily N-acetyltransferase